MAYITVIEIIDIVVKKNVWSNSINVAITHLTQYLNDGHLVIFANIFVFISHRKWRVWPRFYPGARQCYFSFGLARKESGDALWSAWESTAHIQVWHTRSCVLNALVNLIIVWIITNVLTSLSFAFQLVHQSDGSRPGGRLPLQLHWRTLGHYQRKWDHRLWEVPV